MKGNKDFNQSELVESKGPWPFITRRVYQLPDYALLVWHSREHRKNLHTKVIRKLKFSHLLLRSLWMPNQLNWWIGMVFALGSSLFALGSIFSLMPSLASILSLNTTEINTIFFLGSIPFTCAAYLQLFQAANAGTFSLQGNSKRRSIVWLGWYPKNIGWLSSALQFVGTILFNFNTFNAMLPGLNWLQEDLVIWIPNFLGSVFFLISGYLAFIEVCHSYWSWKLKNISWWVVFINFLGCIAFMISALFAFFPPTSPSFEAVTISVTFTLMGAIAFLIGSLLMLPEMALKVKSS
jgi:hypothetical protein